MSNVANKNIHQYKINNKPVDIIYKAKIRDFKYKLY